MEKKVTARLMCLMKGAAARLDSKTLKWLSSQTLILTPLNIPACKIN